jgi:GTPase SAR1 family protein
MGFWQSLLSFLNLRKKCAANILIIGLDNSGKSSVIQSLKVGGSHQSTDPVVPTIGFQSEIIRCNVRFLISKNNINNRNVIIFFIF